MVFTKEVGSYDNYLKNYYTTQKTLSSILLRAYQLYPNAYSLFSANHFNILADSILYDNYDLSKLYKNKADFFAKKYPKEYVMDLGHKLQIFKENGTLYTDLHTNTLQLDTTIAYSYLYALKYLPTKYDKTPEIQIEKQDILREIASYSDKAIKDSMNYRNIDLTRSQFIASLLLAQVAMEKVLPKDENDGIVKKAIVTMNYILTTNSPALINYIKNTPQNGIQYKRLKFLMDKDETINEKILKIYSSK